jgi:hypothetical protein
MPTPPDCSVEFELIGSAYQRRFWVANGLLACSLVFSFFGIKHLPGHQSSVGIAAYILVGIGGFIASIAYGASGPKLICPACNKASNDWEGRFCPECGNESVKARDSILLFQRAPNCEACQKVLSSGRNGARYKIHYCRHCGAFLSERGIRP